MDENTPLLPSLQQQSADLTRHQKAAWILDEIIRGASVNSIQEVPPTKLNRSIYLFFRNTGWLRLTSVFLLLLLSFWELPSWCSSNKQCVSPDGSNLPMSGFAFLTGTQSVAINCFLLLILISFAILDYMVTPMQLHLQNKTVYILLSLLAIDAFYMLIFGGYPPIRFSPFLRFLLPLLYWSNLRECTMSITAVIEPFLDVVLFVVLFTLMFGWIITVLFHDVPEADQYFGDLITGFYSGFTAMTTADWPMQIVSIMDVNYATTILFIIAIVIGVFLLFNVLLAVVYNAYTGHIEELVAAKFESRFQSLSIAYDVLRGHVEQTPVTQGQDQGQGQNENEDEELTVTLPDVTLLFKELRKNKTHAHFEDDVIGMVFTALDDDKDSELSRTEFADVVNVMQLKFVEELQDDSPVAAYFPTFYDSMVWQSISSYVQSNNFNYVIDAFMIFNVIVVIIETTMDLQNKDTATSVVIFSLIECAFTVVYLIEMVLKIVVAGFSKYWSNVGNQFDFWITWLLLGASVYVLWPYVDNNQDIVRLFIILRCLRLVAILSDVPRFRQLVRVFSVLIPASLPLFSFMFLSIYFFSALGNELFGGLVYRGNPALDPTVNPSIDAFVSANYWALNFNDLASGWFTIFCTIIVAYLTEVAQAMTVTSKLGEWAKVYFIFNFVMNTLIVSNCVVAFVVDLFVEEDEAESESDDKVTTLINDVQSRYGAKRVKVIMRRSTAHQVYANMFKERLDQIIANRNA